MTRSRTASRPTRRDFLRGLVFGSATSMIAGTTWAGTPIALAEPSSSSSATAEFGVLRLRTADFPPLDASFGSVRLAFAALGQVSPMPPFIVSRDEGDFFVVSAECTHQACLIRAFSTTKTSTCPCHGSRFGHDGRTLRGPANEPLPPPLRRYEVTSPEAGLLEIVLPEIPGYELSVQRVQSAGPLRAALRFRSLSNVEYEVLTRSSPAMPWEAHDFSSSENGPADRRSIKGNGRDMTVYIDAPATNAMFVVSARIREV